MSLSEILMIVFGLYLGYWVVANLMPNVGRDRRNVLPDADRNDTADAPRNSEPEEPAWHDVLGVAPGASTEEILHAYQDLLGQYHPDKVATLGTELQELAGRKSKELHRAYGQAMAARATPT